MSFQKHGAGVTYSTVTESDWHILYYVWKI